ncbi:hypothetical protein E4L95_15870 [Paracoccus liaowanqingii]|uniref:Uncharacterized protein n=1 Tax=Paracoccus liaowanqingii TaxID=2560053 RepID=A0A4Z1C8X1_9RHOB|nr:hypothetical protein [Paracoccus liaowanqingii]TGN53775.1 hypothetical protein E4L95_15870 [Paracoccus liaowanqingii]
MQTHGRTNRRTNGTRLMFISDLRELSERHLPETVGKTRSGDGWSTTRMRPEVANVIDALAQRHVEGTGREITKSEIIAAALNLSLPVLAARMFPATGTA